VARRMAEAYEQFEGAAWCPLPSNYPRREPEKTLLHQVVRENLETLLAQASQDGTGLPRYVEQELRRYLSCGVLSEGFTRAVCEECGDEVVVGFSCKGRGFCPSCCGRRMADTAAHLVDRVLPFVPFRQWVLSYPKRLRLAFARDARAASESTTLFLREVFRWQRQKARRLGVNKPLVGAVCATQRFGSLVNLNIHHHSVLPDGVFFFDAEGRLSFLKLPAPKQEELVRVLTRVVKKTLAMAERRGLCKEGAVDALFAVQAEALQTSLGLIPPREEGGGKLSAFLEGFSLEAGTHVHANDRKGLEHLVKYALRPPVASDRLSLAPDGRIVLTLKRPLRDGTSKVGFTPLAFVRRLSAIVPPPRFHTVRYFGVFAPTSKVRPLIVRGHAEEKKPPPEERKLEPKRPDQPPSMAAARAEGGPLPPRAPLGEERPSAVDWLSMGPPPFPERPRRLDWPALLLRVFENDVLACRCGGRRKVLAFMPEPTLARSILERLGVPSTAPPIAPARAPPCQEELEFCD
jgi:hypothetical protein